jgi:hypothetical protein
VKLPTISARGRANLRGAGDSLHPDPGVLRRDGLHDKAVRRKIESGVWLEDRVWKKAPDGHILIDLEGY